MALYIVSTPIGNLEDITLRALKVLFSVSVILAEDTRRTGNLLEVYRRKVGLLEEILKLENSGQDKSDDFGNVIQSFKVDPAMDPGLRRDDEHTSSSAITHPPRSEDPSQEGMRVSSPSFAEATAGRREEIKHPRFISFHEYNEDQRLEEVVGMLKEGVDIALVSDAGTPLISDPGFKLVRRSLKEKIRVVSIPGPSAWVTALTSSGMPTDRVFFFGYFSPRQVRRRKELYKLREAFELLRKSPTLVFYESPHRLLMALKDILEICGNVELTLASELTKVHEKVEARPVSLWIAELNKTKKIRGEYVGLFRFDSEELESSNGN